MTTRTVTAMFNSRAEAERAVQQLTSELGVDRAMVRISPEAGATDTGYSRAQPYQETGFLAALRNLFVPDEDRYAYAEGLRRGGVLVSAQLDEGQLDQASDILENAGAVDLDAQEASWRQSGWSGYDATAAASARSISGTSAATPPATATTVTDTADAGVGRTAATTASGRDEAIPVVEERLVVGKREVDRGRVRVRSYVVEQPVEEQVRLHDERVAVERHPVDRPLSDADRSAAFQDRVIEASATGEEAVVGKEARVIEEIDVRKQAADRTETVRDTVRKTEVEVDDGSARSAGTTRTAGATGPSGTGTGVGAAVDRTLGTNISSTDPGRKS
ncbi:MAG: YsnF/AvaK domain-containing protein [Acetobacteraceae bacterium]|nr:YsnF/AvaK domain-containing protein [Acetobacteraceae bacterium]